jgi:hypothetical protein
MSVQIRIGDVMDDVIFELHLPSYGMNEFITTDQAIALLKASATRLSGVLTRLYSDGLFAETATLTTVPNFDLVSLPEQFATLRSVHWVASNGTAYPLTRADVHEYVETPVSWGDPNNYWSCDVLPMFTLEANVLRLVPTPTQAYTLRVAYTTGVFLELDSSSESVFETTFAGQIGWREWMVADICYRMAKREQRDPTNFLNDLAVAEAQMKDHISQRDRYSTYQVRDTRNNPRGVRNRRWGW